MGIFVQRLAKGSFGMFWRKKKFLSEKQHKKNLASQLSMSPLTVKQLRTCSVVDDTLLKLEFFYQTDSREKAEALYLELSGLGYSAEFGEAADEQNIQIVTGWTTPLSMKLEEVVGWTETMCNIGYTHDCEFDGWGTNPEQLGLVQRES